MNLLKQNLNKVIILIIFSGLFVVGFCTYQDYGISVDEKFQRSNGFFWLDYLLSYTNFNNLKILVSQKLVSIDDFTLADVSNFNTYGILFDLPAALLEVSLKLEDTKDIYNFRHFLNFLYFFVGSIFFYRILANRFNAFLSLIGTMFFILSPRIYGESFYNSKDIIFLSFLCIAIFYCFQFFKKKDLYNLILFSFFTAACIQTRVIGIFLPFSFFLFYILAIVSNKKEINFISKYLLYFITSFLFLFLFWPFLWESPIQNFISLFSNLSSLTPDIKILFNDKFIDVNYMPFEYLPVWIIISSPTINSILFISGSIILSYRLIKRLVTFEGLKYNKFDLWRSANEQKDLFVLINFYTILLTLISFNITMISSWRYVFFLHIFIVYITTFTIHYLFSKIKNKKNIYSLKILLVLLILFNLYKVYSYHPFQGIFFNSFLSQKYKNSYEIDYSSVSGKDALKWIVNNNDGEEKIQIGIASWSPLYRNIDALEKKDRELLSFVGQNYNEAKYIYTNNISEVDKTKDKKYDIPNDFRLVHKLVIDKITVYEIYKRK